MHLILGDALVEVKKLGTDSIDLVLTDIPYGEVNREAAIRNLDKGKADVLSFSLPQLVSELVRVCRGSFYMFCGIEQVSELKRLFVDAGCVSVRLGIWEKSNASPMNGSFSWLSNIECCLFAKKSGAFFSDREAFSSCVWQCPCIHEMEHPTQKPLDLFARLVCASSKQGDVVFDPFMGSGTTGIACSQLHRRFIGCEIDSAFFLIAAKRIEKATGIFDQLNLWSKGFLVGQPEHCTN